jgi:O-antigen ligase
LSGDSIPQRLLRENVVLLLVAMLVVIPLLMPLARGTAGRAISTGLLQSMGVFLLVILLASVDVRSGARRLPYLAGSGVNAPLALFLLWAGVGALRAPDRPFAVAEMLRLSTGGVVYFALALHLETRAQLRLLVDCLFGIVILAVGYALIVDGNEATLGIASVLPSRHHLSAILAVLLPLLVSHALGAEAGGHRVPAIAAAILGAIGLLLCLERSAWIAAVVGLLVCLFLGGRSTLVASTRRSWRGVLVVLAASLLISSGFFALTGMPAAVADRARHIQTAVQGQDPSFAWRVAMWRGAARMVAQRPLWGWGPGQFVLHQATYTHLGRPGMEVREYGASFDEMAYNEYVQTAAELGSPGLALYLLVLAAFFSKAARALRRLPYGLRRTVLLGCTGGVASQMVDAMANGSWRYPECSVFFWLVLGLGVAVIRMAYQRAPAGAPAGLRAGAVDDEGPHAQPDPT